MTHGLVVGKFYPPHAGHDLLVRAAASACEKVTVIVMAASHESIPLATRIAWLREIHSDDPRVTVLGTIDDVPIDYADPRVWDQHEALMRQALIAGEAAPVTAVFSSEAYGEELARRFDATAVCVDPDRRLVPVSSTQVRENPAANWDYLAEPVRAGLAMRVVVVGAESTGKTSLARALAQHWRSRGGPHGLTRCVPEFGRAYTAQKWASARARAQVSRASLPPLEKLDWRTQDFVHIASAQVRIEEQEARSGGPLLVCDTDALATAVWHERYLGRRSEAVERLSDPSAHALYLLTDHQGVAFEQDGLRDGESIRSWMTARFIEVLSGANRPWLCLSGTRDHRMRQAIAATESLLEDGWRFAQSLV